ncbi:MAG: MarR family transcriptional regulator [Lachnospiraceae bacterium]|nr:MarR family transcriptional regulator [Lachnospiraceae bacterium]
MIPNTDEFLKAMYRFHHLNIQVLIPELSRAEAIIINNLGTADREEGLGLKMSTLGKVLCVSMPSLSRMIKGLEERGLVKREIDVRDRRNTYVVLTDKGRELFEKTDEVMTDFIMSVYERVGEKKLTQLGKLMSEMADVASDEINKRKIENNNLENQ